MQENEFEKQVKQMMDEFKLQPSNDAWSKIDRRINGDRRKKRPFILLLVSCLLVSGFIMYRYEVNTADHAAKNNAKDAVIHSNKANALKDSNTIITNTDAQTNKKDTAFVRQSEKDKNGTVNMLHIQSHSSSASINVATQKETMQPLQTEIDQQSNAKIDEQKSEQAMMRKENAPASTTVDNNAEMKQQQNENKDSFTVIANNNNVAKADVVNNNTLKNDSVASTQHNTVTKKVSDTKTKLPDLQWGVTAFFGGSNAVNDLVSSNKSLPSSLNSGGSNFDTAYSNKPYTASTAYRIGFVVEKRIIKNGFIATGLNYAYLSTKSTVGKSIDSTLLLPQSAYAINSFYQSGTTSTYTNHYNFIELPVYFKQDFFPSKKIGLSYNAGFSIRQMISSNSLVYDPSYNIYFSKDDMLHKTQVQFLAGLSLKINSSKNSSLYIGPQFSYSFSSLFKNNSGNFHLIDYGVHAGLLFHKK